MRQAAITIGVIMLVAGGVAWLLYGRMAPAPVIAITSPAAGDVWQAGDTRTIVWATQHVPAQSRIAITIRRVPPPPLPEEGQEFDPVVFTDVPNTGSTTWPVSPQYPDGTYVLGITAYTAVPISNPVTAESAPFTIAHPKLAADLYPLYGSVGWGNTVAQTVTVGTTTYAGARVTSEAVDAGMNPGAVFTPFEHYYDKLLKAHGWRVASDLAAGGHTGGQTGYRHGADVILVGFNIEYQNRPADAPSECPCTVSLSLFSQVTN